MCVCEWVSILEEEELKLSECVCIRLEIITNQTVVGILQVYKRGRVYVTPRFTCPLTLYWASPKTNKLERPRFSPPSVSVYNENQRSLYVVGVVFY